MLLEELVPGPSAALGAAIIAGLLQYALDGYRLPREHGLRLLL